ncbi:MAG: formamidase [Gammaproteobacteria bacterium]|nr:formamidase [Gammaproteobacteria bacterium]
MTVNADTTDQQWLKTVEIKKSGEHCADDPHCMNRYHPAIPAIATAAAGDAIVFHTRDALDSDLGIDSVADDLAAVDLNLVHPMTGPVAIEGAKRGDALEVEILAIKPDQYGYTLIVPGFGFLRDLFPEPFIVNWKATSRGAVSEQMPGVTIPYEAFPGSIGVLPGKAEVAAWKAREAKLAEFGGIALGPQPTGARPSAVCGPSGSHKEDCLRTIAPRENGGNMDVQQMQVGTKIIFPCFVDGCGLFVGDVHYAQGDGEVSGTAIEMGAVVTVRTRLLPGKGADYRVPHVSGNSEIRNIEPTRFYQTLGMPLKSKDEIPPYVTYLDSKKIGELENLSEDLTLAARNALIEMLTYIQREHGLSREQAYVLASVAVDLRVGQVVDVPNYVVSAVLNLDVFDKLRN